MKGVCVVDGVKYKFKLAIEDNFPFDGRCEINIYYGKILRWTKIHVSKDFYYSALNRFETYSEEYLLSFVKEKIKADIECREIERKWS